MPSREKVKNRHLKNALTLNKAGYTATLVACGWAGAEKVPMASGQELYGQKAQKRQKSNKGIERPTIRPTDRLTD